MAAMLAPRSCPGLRAGTQTLDVLTVIDDAARAYLPSPCVSGSRLSGRDKMVAFDVKVAAR